jgi:hypothetical protein
MLKDTIYADSVSVLKAANPEKFNEEGGRQELKQPPMQQQSFLFDDETREDKFLN